MAWYHMLGRCYDVNNPQYIGYGKRGIDVSEEWKNNFDNFSNDMITSYKNGLTIDRIDNDKGYSLNNCKWSTYKEQASNRRSNTNITINGIAKTLTQWAEELGLKSSTVRQRYYVYKWDINKCLTKKEGKFGL